MQRCIFNEIVEGRLPCHKVYEDEGFLAFLDIFPRTEGHTLVVPKTQYRWTYDVPDFGRYWETVRMITRVIQQVLPVKWVNYFTYGEIPYAHIHILPRYEDINGSAEQIVPPPVKAADRDLAKVAEKIRQGFACSAKS